MPGSGWERASPRRKTFLVPPRLPEISTGTQDIFAGKTDVFPTAGKAKGRSPCGAAPSNCRYAGLQVEADARAEVEVVEALAFRRNRVVLDADVHLRRRGHREV